MGTLAGGLAMKQAINNKTDKLEYKTTTEKWGSKKFSEDLAYRIF